MDKTKRPKKRPEILGSPQAPKKSIRPKSRDEALAVMSGNRSAKRRAKEEGMAKGGMVARGCGAAKKGGKYTRSG